MPVRDELVLEPVERRVEVDVAAACRVRAQGRDEQTQSRQRRAAVRPDPGEHPTHHDGVGLAPGPQQRAVGRLEARQEELCQLAGQGAAFALPGLLGDAGGGLDPRLPAPLSGHPEPDPHPDRVGDHDHARSEHRAAGGTDDDQVVEQGDGVHRRQHIDGAPRPPHGCHHRRHADQHKAEADVGVVRHHPQHRDRGDGADRREPEGGDGGHQFGACPQLLGGRRVDREAGGEDQDEEDADGDLHERHDPAECLGGASPRLSPAFHPRTL